ncbi:MAG: hypothetical protein EBS54_01565 [Betaproteobacteria bacterium]|nr:hypothetical protein [Betaproteobacteria bacterium]NBT05483.1 hypothetical protein [Betaproteobacteria bacterium]NCY07413.1 hypothetical protein [Betaproteobacteria bacterium]NDE53344.1 hypothetical protein [Actinomycetota bacterium]NDG82493.1 hypothetical protein [Betaproteobacteria bacterium]
MNVKIGSLGHFDHRGTDALKAGTASAQDVAKKVAVAQSSAKAIHEVMAKSAAAAGQPVLSSAPSAQLAVDAARIGQLAAFDETQDSGRLDTDRLDSLKQQIKDGTFDIDFGFIASELARQATSVRGRRS